MKKNKHPLRDAVPEQLAAYLDAYVLDGPDPAIGKPGFPMLREAWAGELPYEPILEMVPHWLEQQTELQLKAQQVYSVLTVLEPVRDEETGAIAEWFLAKWAEVLLAMPWDDRLEDAIADAAAYCRNRLR